MKRQNISNNVIRRLPRYLRKLDELSAAGAGRISSSELGQQMNLTPSQIRQDFSCFGEFGQQGYGYNVEMLRNEISSILGMTRCFSVVLVGVGNLGHALIENFAFAANGFNLIAAFDTKPSLIGTSLNGVEIRAGSDLPVFLEENHVDIAVLTVPKRIANDVAMNIVNGGVRAIWNFTNIELNVQRDDVFIEDIHFSDSLLALSYFLSESMDEKQKT